MNYLHDNFWRDKTGRRVSSRHPGRVLFAASGESQFAEFSQTESYNIHLGEQYQQDMLNG